MATNRHGVIKQKDVAATGAQTADASVLGSRLRIPKDLISVQNENREDQVVDRASRLLRRDTAAVAAEKFEVFTRDIEKVETPKQHDASKHDDTSKTRTIEEVEAEWEARLEEQVALAREEAFQEGRSDAKSDYDRQVAELKERFASDLDGIQASWERFMRRAEPKIVQLAFEISRVVLDAPIPDEIRSVCERTIADTIERMATDVPVEIVLHPVSYLRLQEIGVEEQLNATHSKLRWRTNPEMKQNEWTVQSQRSATRRLEGELIDQLQRELSLRELHRDHPTSQQQDTANEDKDSLNDNTSANDGKDHLNDNTSDDDGNLATDND